MDCEYFFSNVSRPRRRGTSNSRGLNSSMWRITPPLARASPGKPSAVELHFPSSKDFRLPFAFVTSSSSVSLFVQRSTAGIKVCMCAGQTKMTVQVLRTSTVKCGVRAQVGTTPPPPTRPSPSWNEMHIWDILSCMYYGVDALPYSPLPPPSTHTDTNTTTTTPSHTGQHYTPTGI